jgi:AcrR family transcriptional regulator
VFIEQGAAAPLDEIARRAGIGIATLYRRFPDRAALIRAVTLDAVQRTTDEARRAAEEEPDPFRALARYMHRAIDARTAAVIPALLGEVDFGDEDIARARADAPAAIDPLVDAAKRAGALRADVTSGDIGMLIVRMTRPLPGPFPAEMNNSLGHRHLALLIDGLRPATREPVLPGPALTIEDLRDFPQPSPGKPVSNPLPPSPVRGA